MPRWRTRPVIDGWEFETRPGIDCLTLKAILSLPYLIRITTLEICSTGDRQLHERNCKRCGYISPISPTRWDLRFTVPRQEVKSTFSKSGALRGEFR
jgi:hypothetical protein